MTKNQTEQAVGTEPRAALSAYLISSPQELVPKISLLAPVSVALRRRALFFWFPVAFAVLAATVSLTGNKYSAEATFMPHISQSELSQLAGLASQFGVNVGGVSGGESVEFYAALVDSRQVLEQVALTKYTFATGSDPLDTLSGTLIQLLEIGGSTPHKQLVNAVKLLQKHIIKVGSDDETGLVTVKIVAPWPRLAELVNRRLLDLVNQFNMEKRQSNASAERIFTEGRVKEMKDELTSAENDMQAFLQENRTYQNSPRLLFEYNRLQRQIDLRQQVYTTLNQEYEQARVDEVRDTPVITIVDAPEGAGKWDPHLGRDIALAVLLGLVLAAATALLAEYLLAQREAQPEQFYRFDALFQESISDLRPRALWGHFQRLPKKAMAGAKWLSGRRQDSK